MGEAKRRAQLDPTWGKFPSHTHKMLRQLSRRELEDLTASLGLLFGQLLTSAGDFIGDVERSEVDWNLSAHFPAYVAFKEQVETSIDWMEDGEKAA